MTFLIMTVLTVAAMVVAGVVAYKKAKRSYYFDAEDVAMAVFFTWLVAFVVSWIVIGIAAASLTASSKAEWVQTGKWEQRLVDGTTPQWDAEDGETEFFLNNNGVVHEVEHYGHIPTLPGGDGRTLVTVDQVRELGTSVFPWGQSQGTRTVNFQ